MPVKVLSPFTLLTNVRAPLFPDLISWDTEQTCTFLPCATRNVLWIHVDHL